MEEKNAIAVPANGTQNLRVYVVVETANSELIFGV